MADRLVHALGAASLVYVFAGVWWAFGDAGFPFGPGQDPLGENQSPLGSVDHGEAWPYVVGLGLAGVATARGLARADQSRRGGRFVVASAALQGVVYAVLLPDGRPLIAAAHVPVLLVGKPFGWPPGVTIGSQVPWPVVHQMLLLVLGAAWMIAAVRTRRRIRGACVGCGRGRADPQWMTPAAARRWGRWAVATAMVVPAAYASSRLAWALDIPYGVTRRFLTEMRAEEPTIFVAGAAMAMLGLGGAALTFGLVGRWGERWPRWMPWLGGRDVPLRVAVVPTVVVAALLISAGKGWYWSAVQGHLPEELFGENWATVVFGAFLPVWGLALGAAGYAYWLRRRGICARCRLGSEGDGCGHPPTVALGPGDQRAAQSLDPGAGVV